MPPDRQQADAHDLAGARLISTIPFRRLGASRRRSGRPPRSWCATSAQLDTPRALDNFARLDRSHRGRRVAQTQAAAAARHRAQRRRHHVGLGDAKTYLHDEIATDKRNPTVNPYGKIYGAHRRKHRQRADPRSDDQLGDLSAHDPRRCQDAERRRSSLGNFPRLPSPYWGDEMIWHSQTTVHNPMFDQDGSRLVHRAHPCAARTPAYCRKGSDLPSAKLFPMDSARAAGRDVRSQDRQVQLRRSVLRHPPHGVRRRRQQHAVVLAPAAPAPVVGWLNTKKFLETGDAAASQGWTAVDPRHQRQRQARRDYVEPNQPVDPAKDKRIVAGLYGVGLRPDRRHHLGLGARPCRAAWCA